MLRVTKDVVHRWETAVQPGELRIRWLKGRADSARSNEHTPQGIVVFTLIQFSLTSQTCETMTLLHAAALKTTDEDNPTALNPTPGVSSKNKPHTVFKDLVFEKDASKPGGGVFVAKDAEHRNTISPDIPQHIIMTRAEYADRSLAHQAQPGTFSPAPNYPSQYDQLLQSVHGGAGYVGNVNPQIDIQTEGYGLGPHPGSTVTMIDSNVGQLPLRETVADVDSPIRHNSIRAPTLSRACLRACRWPALTGIAGDSTLGGSCQQKASSLFPVILFPPNRRAVLYISICRRSAICNLHRTHWSLRLYPSERGDVIGQEL